MSERPLPDEAPLEARRSRFCDQRIRDLSFTDWRKYFRGRPIAPSSSLPDIDHPGNQAGVRPGTDQ